MNTAWRVGAFDSKYERRGHYEYKDPKGACVGITENKNAPWRQGRQLRNSKNAFVISTKKNTVGIV